jgi:beta-lactamase regulating signal transducer with metallopeptidase domain
MTSRFIVNHLWQSSCIALLGGLLAFLLRKNSAKARYWVWLSASLKFLLPFALLVSLGGVVPQTVRNPVFVPTPVFPTTLVQIAEPFLTIRNATNPTHASLRAMLPVAIGAVWAAGFFAITLTRCRSWLGIRAALRAGTPIELPIPICALITPGLEEPGIVGFLRPVLVLPARLLEQLNPRELGAILAHELCHVRRRDNFFAAVHMAVEAIFWFHPLVWWIGSRMVEERELACDEAVLQMGVEPTDYVEGILKVCRFYTESPMPCVSGVTGADLKRRLRAILAGGVVRELSVAKKAVVAAIGLAAIAAPIVIGMLSAPAIRAQSTASRPQTPKPAFEVASIKPAGPDARGTSDLPPQISTIHN